MRNDVLKSSLWMLGGNGLQQVIGFAIFVLLARFLDPHQFGTVAIAALIYEIVSAVGKWGVSDMLIQRRKATPLFISHAFVFVVSIAIVLVLVVLAGTSIYAMVEGWSLLSTLLFLLCPVVLMEAVSVPSETMLRLRMQYKWLAIRNNAAALIGGVFAVVLAALGFGVFALVGQRLVSVAVTTVMVLIGARDAARLFPVRRYRSVAFRGIGNVGFHLVSTPLAGMIGPRISDLMVGIFFGPAALGNLRITRRVFDMITQLTVTPISGVAEAAFSRLISKGAELRALYMRMQSTVANGVFPIFAGIAVSAGEWVPLLLGKQWTDSVPLIQLTSLAAVPAVVNYFQTPLLITYRRNKIISIQNIIRIVSSVALTAVAVPLGIKAVVLFFVLQGYVFMIANFVIIKRTAGWPVLPLIRNLVPPTVTTIASVAAVLAFRYWAPPYSLWLTLTLELAFGALVYALIMFTVFRHTALPALAAALRLVRRK